MNKLPIHDKYNKPFKMAKEALRLAKLYQTPPAPKTYETWYSYAAGDNTPLIERIDSVIKAGGTLSSYEIEQIHTEFVSLSQAQANQHDAASMRLDREMEDILKLVQTHLTSSEEYTGSLDENIKTLEENSSPHQILETMKSLIAENSKMRGDTANLVDNLKQSKKQVLEMQSTLKKSQANEMKDALTNMPNRRHFDMALTKAIADAQEENSPMCLIMVDLDKFKLLNDNFGHLIGDEVLKFVASLLMKNVKGRDTSARYGGEEFAIILPNTDIENAKTLIESIRVQLESANLVLTKRRQSIGKVTASFGITQIRKYDDAQELIRRADAKLYEAKKAGRNRIAFDELKAA